MQIQRLRHQRGGGDGTSLGNEQLFFFFFRSPFYLQFSPIINFDQSKKTARTVREDDGGGEMEPVCRQAAEQGGRGTHRCTGGRQSPPFDFLCPLEQLTSCESGTERIKKVNVRMARLNRQC